MARTKAAVGCSVSTLGLARLIRNAPKIKAKAITTAMKTERKDIRTLNWEYLPQLPSSLMRYFRQTWNLAGLAKEGQKEHRSNPYDDQYSRKDDGSPKQKSLETVQWPAGDRHIGAFKPRLSIAR